MTIVAILAVCLLALAAGAAYAAYRAPQLRRSEYLEQIEAYGYSSTRPEQVEASKQARIALDTLAAKLGEAAARRLRLQREDQLQKELISAGFYSIGARRFLGYRLLATVLLPIAILWLGLLLGVSTLLLVVCVLAGIAIGWYGPTFVVHRRARLRLARIDDALPELIDLLVVTLEAGVAFTAALRMSAEKLKGPLGDEIRLTIQEQALGLSTLVALEHWLDRCETPSVRSFVRSMVQGDRLGVSIGQILRNQAVEMRQRRKHMIEERAQKAPVKILFPLVLLIFPAMFVIILGPALFTINQALK